MTCRRGRSRRGDPIAIASHARRLGWNQSDLPTTIESCRHCGHACYDSRPKTDRRGWARLGGTVGLFKTTPATVGGELALAGCALARAVTAIVDADDRPLARPTRIGQGRPRRQPNSAIGPRCGSAGRFLVLGLPGKRGT